MEPLDLTKRPPRSTRAMLDGLVMLPRTIDKMRALLPGGNIGNYKIEGFSARMLSTIGVDPEALQSEVARASSEQEIAVWVRSHADPDKYEEANHILLNRSIDDILPERRAWFEETYPVHKKIASRRLCDIIDADDAEMFDKQRTDQSVAARSNKFDRSRRPLSH
jgi:hypothetical protein